MDFSENGWKGSIIVNLGICGSGALLFCGGGPSNNGPCCGGVDLTQSSPCLINSTSPSPVEFGTRRNLLACTARATRELGGGRPVWSLSLSL